MSTIPLPMDWENLPEPLETSAMPDDPFPMDLFSTMSPGFDYVPEDDSFEPFATALPLPELMSAVPSPSPDVDWAWHDAALIAVERTSSDSQETTYAIGAVDLYANARTGDIGGSYLEIASFQDIDEAAAYYHTLQGEIHDRRVLPFHLPDFAGEKAQERAVDPANLWRACSPAEYAAYEAIRSPEADSDLTLDAALEPMPAAEQEKSGKTFQALHAIGITPDGFNPETDPPPFLDPETGTAYWIGVFQPDRTDPSNCVTSILSLGRNSQTGEMEAQLAPCVPGDWEKAYSAAEFLLDAIEKGGIERCLDAAEGMALASDQRGLWEAERGIPLDAEDARDLANFTREQWEIDL